MPQQFDGLVIGGPHDGKYMSWRAPYFEVALMPAIPAFYEVSDGTDAAEAVSYEVFTYGHENFYDREFWIPSPIQSGGMYDHVHYRDPIEFIMQKLMAGYRPEVVLR